MPGRVPWPACSPAAMTRANNLVTIQKTRSDPGAVNTGIGRAGGIAADPPLVPAAGCTAHEGFTSSGVVGASADGRSGCDQHDGEHTYLPCHACLIKQQTSRSPEH